MDRAEKAIAGLLQACNAAGLYNPVERVRVLAHALVHTGLGVGMAERQAELYIRSDPEPDARLDAEPGLAMPVVVLGSRIVSPWHGLSSWEEELARLHAGVRLPQGPACWHTHWRGRPLWAQERGTDPADGAQTQRLFRVDEFGPLPLRLTLPQASLEAVTQACRPTAEQLQAQRMEQLAWQAGRSAAGGWPGSAVAGMLAVATELNVHSLLPVRVELHTRWRNVAQGQWEKRVGYRFVSEHLPGFGVDITLSQGPNALVLVGQTPDWQFHTPQLDSVRTLPYQRALPDAPESGIRALAEAVETAYLQQGGSVPHRGAPRARM